ncbi:MAG: hypothetical protein KME60_21240 [Cyanomargarita calcarea GSE-NOS-MK-12-04C]|jgi:hypothetical protein|uniref:Uncharacterized protein n=1 Tax=Cyanomargarita calcarea GSE-NOS-MK-12-04C TaxID=2839659 RepID=A0A951QS82_9CYAN|nr:hypothetical protein [Cyanomargarita calcarea GSE-NOS-MK-12-04C]
MPAKQSISLIALSLLIALPAGFATAGDIDIQNGDVRVTVTQDSGVRINSIPTRPTIIRTRSTPIYRQSRTTQRSRILKAPQPLRCNGRTITQHSNQGYGNNSNSTYSSTTTSSCQ